MRVGPAALLLLGVVAACGSRSTLDGESFIGDPYGSTGSSGGSGTDGNPELDAGGSPPGSIPDAATIFPDDVMARPPDAGIDPPDAPAFDAPVADDAPAACEGACQSISFASGPTWMTYDGSMTASPPSFVVTSELGRAVDVCTTATSPAGCPMGALVWNFDGGTWTGGETLPDAWWIWRPDVTASSPAAFGVAIFQSTFVVGTAPQGSIHVSVDDLALVFVNDTWVGTLGSLTDVNVAGAAHTAPTSFDLTPGLHPGANIITVAAENGPFNCPGDTCSYSGDPAGVVFDGTLSW